MNFLTKCEVLKITITGTWENSRFCLYDIRAEDFQAHLERIPEYLSEDWWYHDDATNEIVFRDGDDEPNFHDAGPSLKSFSEHGIHSIQRLVLAFKSMAFIKHT